MSVLAPASLSAILLTPSRAPAAVPVPKLSWRACQKGFQCATARVPLDYSHPRGRMIHLAVIRHRATDPAWCHRSSWPDYSRSSARRAPARAPPRSGPWSASAFRRSGPLGLSKLWQTLPCASWPATAADLYAGPWDRRTANPVLVTNNTIDPNTPYRGAVAMARELARARLLTVDGYGHGVLGNQSACATRYISRYLIERALPPKGAVCQQDQQPFSGSP